MAELGVIRWCRTAQDCRATGESTYELVITMDGRPTLHCNTPEDARASILRYGFEDRLQGLVSLARA